MGRAVHNPALSDLRAELELGLEEFKARFNAESCTKSELQSFHRHYKNLVAWEEEAIAIAYDSGSFDPLKLDRMRLTIEYSKRREGFLWMEILSFSDESFVQSIQPSPKQGELCLF